MQPNTDNPGWLTRHTPRQPGDIAHVALVLYGVIATAADTVALVESYSNLLAFARAYGLSGWRAAIAPGAVDSFIVMGELLLFAAILLHWGKLAHSLGAGMASWGFLLSVGGNVWHAPVATATDRAVSAVWPVTATVALAGALLIVRQIMTAGDLITAGKPDEAAAPLPELAPAPAPAVQPAPVSAPRRRPGRVPSVSAEEQVWLAELLAAGTLPPSYRAWSHEKNGSYRSAATKRVYDEAKIRLGQAAQPADQDQLAGDQVAPDGDQDQLAGDQAALDHDLPAMNGASHG